MAGRRYVIFTSIFEFGGSNTYLKLLNSFLRGSELHFVLSNKVELERFGRLSYASSNHFPHILSGLQPVAKIGKASLLRNPGQFLQVIISILRVVVLLVRLRTRRIVISAVKSEKYLYLTCIPFLHIRYIVHTVPKRPSFALSSILCNYLLSDRKKIFTVSAYGKGELIRFWEIKTAKQRHIGVIHNTVFNEQAFKQNKWSSENKSIVTLAHSVDYKNPYQWVKVAKKITTYFPDVEFKWFGDGPLFEELVSATKEYDRINFFKGPGDVSSCLSSAYLYYQPSKIESHGIAVLEAMASSMPCVVSNVGGLPESVINDWNGFVVDVDVESEHVAAISKLLNDKTMAARFSVNSLNRYNEFFSVDVWRAKMEQSFGFK